MEPPEDAEREFLKGDRKGAPFYVNHAALIVLTLSSIRKKRAYCKSFAIAIYLFVEMVVIAVGLSLTFGQV
jgi:hypothetical protein